MDNNVGMTSEGGGNGDGGSASNGVAGGTNNSNSANGGCANSAANSGNVADDAQPQLFCLRWNNYQTNLTCSFDQLLQSELLVDVTLACADGQFMKAHRMVLSACSPYFQTLFSDNPCKHPIVILKDIGWNELKAVVEFMYKGEINVCQEQIEPLLKVAESLKIRGLADVSSGQDFARAAAASSAAAAAAAERNNRSPTASSDTSAAPIRASPSRGAGCAVGANAGASGGPSRKRRRTSADRMNGGADDSAAAAAFNAALNSPSRPFELISSSPMAATVNVSSASSAQSGAQGHNHSQQQHQQSHANRPPSQSSAAPQSPPNMPSLPIPPPPHSATPNAMASTSSVADDMEIKPGIAEMIREEERAKMFESSQAWLNASTSSLAYVHPSNYDASSTSAPSTLPSRGDGAISAQPAADANFNDAPAGERALADFTSAAKAAPKLKTPSWTKAQLKQAIKAVITQQLRFTEASSAYSIPKGTLYDNILGKTKRMRGLDVAALTDDEEAAVLEFCCHVSASTYNRRTRRALHEVLDFVQALVQLRNPNFRFDEMSGFRWWWAFCKKHSVVVLNYTSLDGDTFVAAGCDRARGAVSRTKAVRRYLRNAKTTQVRLAAHAYVTTSDANEPFDFSTRTLAVSAPPALVSLASAPISSAPPASFGSTPVSLVPALSSMSSAPSPLALAPVSVTSSAGAWNVQQFLAAFNPLSDSFFGGAPVQDIINSLIKEESVN